MWRILVVDDDFVNRKLMLEILKGKAECDVAANAKEALAAYEFSLKEAKQYDVILLDIVMPGVNGIEALKQIRNNEHSQGIAVGSGLPIIMVTAHKEPWMNAFNKGCDDYVLKPVRAQELISKIQSMVGDKK